MQVYVEGVGLCGPGLNGWSASRMVLAGIEQYMPAPVVVPPCDLLPATERRRTVPAVKLALALGSEALSHAGRDGAATATVFTSSAGDGDTIHQILEALASHDREVSPTRFHNSVHNAPAGYWSIAIQSREPTTSLGGYDISFAAGLLEAVVQATVDSRAVALIAYDLPYPEPLHAVRSIGAAFGAALVLTPQPTERTLTQLNVDLERNAASPTSMKDPALEELRVSNPAARSLPLLATLARHSADTVILEYRADTRLSVSMAPHLPKRRNSESGH